MALKCVKNSLLGTLLASAALASIGHAQTSAPAQTIAKSNGVAAEDHRPELGSLLPPHRLLGKTRLRVWGFQVYDARLWVTPGFKPEQFASQNFALELSYLRDFTSADIVERSLEEMRRSATISDEQSKAWTAALLRVMPEVKKGDRITGVHKAGEGAVFLVNGQPGGEIKDPEFARLFFGIWLSPKTSEPDMRRELLAGAL